MAKKNMKKSTRARAPRKALTQLGADAAPAASPDEAVLETAPNPHPGILYNARFTAPEFTSICPVTGQPDFAHIVVDYAPAKHIVESKSLKLYFTAFRDHGAFHEDCTLAIAKKIIAAAKPTWLRIGGYWYPRGGIPIDVFYQTAEPPKGLWLPSQDIPAYRGRG
ncbi:MAG: NADPH-dependent 7-cyano-7-deazaguanine reductase QueF [Marinicaulis sp.]|nr:NADPH-dependent 7-cyano-7-deazaguanine reductase QueF [Marinicaulis sp.]